MQFWDGRAHSLEDQSAGPILAANAMGMDEKTLLSRLRAAPEYRGKFRQAFGGEINFDDVKKAIAAYERTLVTPDSAFDRYTNGDKQALTDQQKRGLIVFFGKGSLQRVSQRAKLYRQQISHSRSSSRRKTRRRYRPLCSHAQSCRSAPVSKRPACAM